MHVPSLRRLTLAFTATLLVLAAHPAAGLAACANPVACENEKPGTAPSVWQGATDSTIQGYATSMSVNVGGTIRFKVKTNASRYHLDIYRLGYYQGNGARLQQANVQPTASLPQSQPACLTTSSTGLIDCGNWGLSASWTVPASLGLRRLRRAIGARRHRRREPDPVRRPGRRRRPPTCS